MKPAAVLLGRIDGFCLAGFVAARNRVFGGPATVASVEASDPWLCATRFPVFCPFEPALVVNVLRSLLSDPWKIRTPGGGLL